jgi:hypothetical protein
VSQAISTILKDFGENFDDLVSPLQYASPTPLYFLQHATPCISIAAFGCGVLDDVTWRIRPDDDRFFKECVNENLSAMYRVLVYLKATPRDFKLLKK